MLPISYSFFSSSFVFINTLFSIFISVEKTKFSVRTESSLPQSSLHSSHTEKLVDDDCDGSCCLRWNDERTVLAAAAVPPPILPLVQEGNALKGRTWWASVGCVHDARGERERCRRRLQTSSKLVLKALPPSSSSSTSSSVHLSDML